MRFPVVAEAIVVIVGVGGVKAVFQLPEIGETVVVAVPLAVIGVSAAGGLAQEAVAVAIFQGGQGAVPALAIAVVVAGAELEEVIKSGGQHIKDKVIAQVNMVGISNVAALTALDDKAPTFKGRNMIRFGQIELGGLIQPRDGKANAVGGGKNGLRLVPAARQ